MLDSFPGSPTGTKLDCSLGTRTLSHKTRIASPVEYSRHIWQYSQVTLRNVNAICAICDPHSQHLQQHAQGTNVPYPRYIVQSAHSSTCNSTPRNNVQSAHSSTCNSTPRNNVQSAHSSTCNSTQTNKVFCT